MNAGLQFARRLVEEVAQIGRTDQGVTRLGFSPADRQARELLIERMTSVGASVRADSVGNLWFSLPGTNPNHPGILMGSHLDSVPQGGDFDGVLGVACAAAVMDQASRREPLTRSLNCVVFACEESSRFRLSCVGSRAVAGQLSLSQMIRFKDSGGVSLLNAIRGFGCEPVTLDRDLLVPGSYEAFLELHIEQGPALDSSDDQLGVVEAIAAPTRFSVTIFGRADHSGACPMELRHDALAAASEVVLVVERVGRAYSPRRVVAAVTTCRVFPNAINVVPGRVELAVDLRGIDRRAIDEAYQAIVQEIDRVAGERQIRIDRELLGSSEPVVLDALLVHRLKAFAQNKGYKVRVMPSGAGHDSMYVAPLIPTAMIFVPCRDGRSHCPEESIDWDRVEPGYDVLESAALTLAARP
ncbi:MULTISPECIES: Zn-dependent hydrolase [Jonquetella]|uniref:Amidase, hydantoinase/carbamoylase family n=1 Tax=Jonquetella anthropi DSM 22815 TaxID=885272 RepID=H0ULK6_9BACT|nr:MULTISPECIES: Zn-dependent hydrolase [Jonquetella]EEX49211.1 amidase, hydantoinase/carbamoylase family [Jonquetella anthropi E3_33 E1]EHM12471.1 amidase, hydantoinase/carbamoylase family [Jonquetella anthropi DSM 22815]ERL24829.1 putative N-carbamyl-L-cysteine amidohydrolase [Jonquetella sp. BV3C21]